LSPIAEVNLVLRRELVKSFRSVKGILLAVLTLLGGTLAALLFVAVEKAAIDPDKFKGEKLAGLVAIYGQDQGEYLAKAPWTLLVMLNVTVWLGPALVWLMGFDTVASDVRFRSVRFWTVRTRRTSFYLGKVLGLWAVVSAVTLAMNLLVWIVIIARGEATAADAFSWGPRFWIVSVPISAAWCGLGILVASQFRTPMVSLLTMAGGFFAMFALWAAGAITTAFSSPRFPRLLFLGREGLVWQPGTVGSQNGVNIGHVLLHVYPNSYDRYLLSPHFSDAVIGFVATLGGAALFAAWGAYSFKRKDI
jgi:ABC-2 type transport system permease protein